MLPVYMGAFLARPLPGRLERGVPNQHVTFQFRPTGEELFPEGMLGLRAKLTIIAEGCDDRNHGYQVEIPETLRRFYRNPATPHVTVSLGPNGRPKDTGALAFTPVQPFTVEAVLGYFMGGDDHVV